MAVSRGGGTAGRRGDSLTAMTARWGGVRMANSRGEGCRWAEMRESLTAGVKERVKLQAGCVEDDRWVGRGGDGRQQGWRMTVGWKGESLTASSVSAYRRAAKR